MSDTPAQIGLDHTVLLVRDLDRAAAQFRRLGFALTPRGHHTGLGSSNNCAMFGNRDYVELLGLAPERGRRPFYEDFLRTREGIVGLAFRTPDARATRERIAGAGFAPPPAVAFGRPVEIDGTTRDARFVTTEADVKTTHGMRLFFCQHETPDLVWLPSFLTHPNGVAGVEAAIAVDVDGHFAEACARLLNLPLEREGDMRLLRAGGHRLEFLPPAVAAKRYPGDPMLASTQSLVAGLRLKVSDLEKTEQLLRAAGVATTRAPDRLTVSSQDALGAILEFA
jgi:hypothetical protein